MGELKRSPRTVDDLYEMLDSIDTRLLEIQAGSMAKINGWLELLFILLSEDIRTRNPEAYKSALPMIEKQMKEWDKLARKGEWR